MSRASGRITELYDRWQADGTKESKEAYQQAVRNYTLQNKYYKDMVDSVTTELANVNQTAVAYLNDQMPSIYRVNFNQGAKDAKAVGMAFATRSEATIARMIKDNNIKLPKKKVQIPKDKRWNTKQLNSSVLQGILQGEPMTAISKRILPIVDNNRAAAVRNARTMVTGAENRGRLDSYKQMESDGIISKKVWLATADGHTRDWHLSMDGQEVGLDEYFIDGNGNELEYPGDPGGEPSSVYNCRCSMVTHITGIRRKDGSIKQVDYQPYSSLHEQQIREEKERR